MRLTQNFTLEELIHTNTGLPNNPTSGEAAKLYDLAASLLQPIRTEWGGMYVSSGYRSPEVNKAVGGVPTSQHCFGEAADIEPLEANIDNVFHWIVRKSGLQYGQCISENKNGKRWIHISLPRAGKKNLEALIYDGQSYKPYA